MATQPRAATHAAAHSPRVVVTLSRYEPVPAGGVGIFFAVLVIAWLSAVVQVARSGVGPEKECA